MTFYENQFISPSENPMIAENLRAKDFMCHHCNRIKLSCSLINSLSKFKDELGTDMYTILGYMCPDLCRDTGEDINNSHTNGNAVDVNFGEKLNLIEAFKLAVKHFSCVGLVLTVTNEFYLHLQEDKTSLYWLCGKKEIDKESEYVYFKDSNDLIKFVESKPELFEGKKI